MTHERRLTTRLLAVSITAILFAPVTRVSAEEFVAVEHKRQTVYHSPEKPGFTSWVGAWLLATKLSRSCQGSVTGRGTSLVRGLQAEA